MRLLVQETAKCHATRRVCTRAEAEREHNSEPIALANDLIAGQGQPKRFWKCCFELFETA